MSFALLLQRCTLFPAEMEKKILTETGEKLPCKALYQIVFLSHPGYSNQHLTTNLYRIYILAQLELPSCLAPGSILCMSPRAQRPVKQCEQSQQRVSPPEPSSAATHLHKPERGQGKKE